MKDRAESLVAEVVREFRVDLTPPLNLASLTRRLGVDDIRLEACREDGSVRRSGSSTIVVLRRDRSRQRQRFTLAHELAHLVLARDGDVEMAFRISAPRSTAVEQLCDNIAAALLMPASWVRAVMAKRSFSLATVRRLAYGCDVSLAASLVRLNEVAGWKGALLRWTYRHGRYRLMSCTGAPPEVRGQLGSAPATDPVLRAAEFDVDQWSKLPVAYGGAVLSIMAQLNSRADTAVALADYRQLSSAPFNSRA
jgi:hypothetical protein